MNWSRLFKFAGISIAVVAVVIVGLAAWLLFAFADYTDTEVARFPNPAGSIDAVVVERSGNATVPMITLAYVVANGAKPSGDPFFLADHVEGLAVNWMNDQTIHIHANNARVSRQLDEAQKAVRIKYDILNVEGR